MGATREKHNENCVAELEALGWWRPTTPPGEDPCTLGDF